MASLDNVKIILDISDASEDDLLNLYIQYATDFVLNECNLDEIPVSLNSAVEKIAVFYYRNKGVENISSEGKGSLSESYRESLPADVFKQLNNHRRVKIL